MLGIARKAMRRLVTFILHLWVDPNATDAWEGDAECVRSGERCHVRGQEEVAQFIQSCTRQNPMPGMGEELALTQR
jgi:hypothetical protein